MQQEWLNASYLASHFVSSPDYREKPTGEKIIVAWDFPYNLFEKGLHLVTTVRLYDLTEKQFTYTLPRKRDTKSYFFPNPDNKQENQVLTYRVDVYDKNEQLIESWEHHLWTEKITIEQS